MHKEENMEHEMATGRGILQNATDICNSSSERLCTLPGYNSNFADLYLGFWILGSEVQDLGFRSSRVGAYGSGRLSSKWYPASAWEVRNGTAAFQVSLCATPLQRNKPTNSYV